MNWSRTSLIERLKKAAFSSGAIAEFAVQRLLAFFAVFGAEKLRGGVGRLRRSVGVEWERRKKAEDERRAKESHAATSKKSSK